MLHAANTRISKPIKDFYQVGDPASQRHVQRRMAGWLLIKRLIFWTAIAISVSFAGRSIPRLNLHEWHGLAPGSQPSAPIETRRILDSTTTSTTSLGYYPPRKKTVGEITLDVDRPDRHDTFVPNPNQPPVFTRGFGTR